VQFESPRQGFVHEHPNLFETATTTDEGTEFTLAHGVSVQAALAALNASPVPIVRFERVQPSLHEIFIEQVEGRVAPRKQEAVNG
jgi:ABC-type uncharacterized transport system ATPase subunit